MSTASGSDLQVRMDLEGPKRILLTAFAALVVIFGLWAGLTRLQGAVIASGSAVVEGRNYPIQSLSAGIVDTVLVQEGDFVEQGTVLMRLDPKLLSIQVESARNRLGAVIATLERLDVEHRNGETLQFDYPDLPVDLPDMTAFEAAESQIFGVRRDLQQGRAAALTEEVSQLRNRLDGGAGQIAAVTSQIETVAATIADMRSLVDQRLMRRRELEAEMGRHADLLGQLAALEAEQGRLTDAIRAAEVQALQDERQFQEQITTDMGTLNDEAQQLILEIATREEELSRVEIHAPADGIVQQLTVSASGAVVAPNQTLLEIIPVTAALEFAVRIPPVSIDEVSVGQQAEVMIAAFDANATPKLVGTVQYVSATALTDDRTGQSYYEAVVVLPEDEIALLDDQIIVPGMPVEVYMQTRARSVLSYLLEPVVDPLRRAFRD
ncbi:MAG: HlyD family type I secretion periplasmic adaptor subunit [Pseudomonadota bacterium]